eukprot:symbB.v1.2.000711.t2/scaffold40.1/size395337/15
MMEPAKSTLEEVYEERKIYVDLPQDIYGVAIAVSELRESVATKLSVKASQLQFVHNGVTLEDFGNDEVQEAAELGSLEMEGWCHERLPERLEEMMALRSIVIKASPLRTIPSPPSKLLVLYLEKTKITTLPPLRGISLKVLQVRSSNLEELPSLPRSLEYLQLEKSALKCLPDLMHCEHLKRLSLDGNRLRELPELPVSLEKISLQDNCLTLPGSFMKLQKLRSLFLNGNGLTELPSDFGSLKALKELHLENNKLRSLPESFGDLTELRKLSLERNPIRRLPDTCSNIQQLEELCIDAERLEEWPSDHWRNLISEASTVAALLCLVNYARFLFGTVSLSLNLWLQSMILYYVNTYIVNGAVHDAQTNYAQFHREVFDKDGTFSQDKWDNWNNGPYLELCNMAVSKLNFSAGIVFLWCARMLNEVRDSWQLASDLYSMESLPMGGEPRDMLNEVLDDSGETLRIEIVAVNQLARALMSLFVVLPKIIVATMLTYIGCRWLAATQSFGDLILNALALEFVIGIDDLMYEAFTPLDLGQFIEKTKFAQPPKATQSGGSEESIVELVRRLGDLEGSLLLLLVMVVWPYGYLNYWQQVLPNFPHDIHDHCAGRFYSHYEQLCGFFGNPSVCFPYGESASQKILWAKSHGCPTKDEKTVVTMYWPRDQMARLLEFIHGGTFVAKVEDLRTAVDCAAFFGVPSLLHHVREWIANNLKVSTAPTLWRFVETEPLLKMQDRFYGDIDGCEDAEDVEAACFEFHLEHFSELAGIKVWESFGGDDETNDASEEEPPMHTLSIELFHRLLMSGLVRLPTRQLICVVERFARAKCSDPSCTEAFAKLFTSLMPPAVIFNRDCRSALLQFNDARTMITI